MSASYSIQSLHTMNNSDLLHIQWILAQDKDVLADIAKLLEATEEEKRETISKIHTKLAKKTHEWLGVKKLMEYCDTMGHYNVADQVKVKIVPTTIDGHTSYTTNSGYKSKIQFGAEYYYEDRFVCRLAGEHNDSSEFTANTSSLFHALIEASKHLFKYHGKMDFLVLNSLTKSLVTTQAAASQNLSDVLAVHKGLNFTDYYARNSVIPQILESIKDNVPLGNEVSSPLFDFLNDNIEFFEKCFYTDTTGFVLMMDENKPSAIMQKTDQNRYKRVNKNSVIYKRYELMTNMQKA